jgi:LuxR family maltose regulon positive regulatory protein
VPRSAQAERIEGAVVVPDSKIRRPRQRTGAIRREQLIERLEDSEHDVTLVLAPAGFGKTTMVSQWAQVATTPVAWSTVGPTDSDPVVLMSTLLAALAGAGLSITPPAGVLTGDEPAFSRRVLPQFQRCLEELDRPVALVVDDIHAMHSAVAAIVLVATVESLPRDSRVALVGRSRPDLPIDLWRGQGRVLELTTAELSFGRAETQASLSGLLGRRPSRDELADVQSRSEGWPVAVYLEGMSIKRRGGVSTTVSPGLDDYVRSQVVAGLDEDLSAFLRRTSILGSLSGPVCDHVLEVDGSADELRRVEAATLLVGRLEGPGGWYRVHPLLRENLAADLTADAPQDARRLHARAARWYADQGQSEEALVHAIACGEADLIDAVGWDYGTETLMLGRTSTMQSWLDQLPPQDIETTPGLALLAAWTGVVKGDSASARRWAEAADRALGPDWIRHLDRSPREPALALLVCLSGVLPHDQAAQLAGAASAALPSTDRTRSLAVLLHGWQLVLSGEIEAGTETLVYSHSLATSMGIGTTSVEAPSLLGFIHASRGDLASAKRMSAAARDAWVAHDLQDAAPSTGLLFALDTYLHARNRPSERTRMDLSRTAPFAEELTRVMPAPAVLVESFVARTWEFLGDRAEASAALHRAETILDRIPPSEWLAGVVASARDALEQTSATAELTAGQRRVLSQLMTDKTMAEIAEVLYLSPNTVKTHAANIYRRLGVESRREVRRMMHGRLGPPDGTSEELLG